MEKKVFIIRGEDKRNIYLARMLMKDGHRVSLWDSPMSYQDIPVANEASISAGPCVLVFALSTPKERLLNTLRTLAQGSICFGGNADEEVLKYAKNNHIQYHNILEYEAFAVLNAIPTAEGALMTVMQNTPNTVHGSKTLVLGYGRIGKAVAGIFYACHSNVTVAARSEEALAYAKGNGYQCIRLSKLASVVGQQDYLLNTIPALILDRQMLSDLKPGALIVDLASGTSNVDHAAAQELGLTVIQAAALPAKVAPASAAQYVKETIEYYLEK